MTADMRALRAEMKAVEQSIEAMTPGPARDAVIRLTKVVRQLTLMVSLSEPVVDMERTGYREHATYDMSREMGAPGDYSRFQGAQTGQTAHSNYRPALRRLLSSGGNAGVT